MIQVKMFSGKELEECINDWIEENQKNEEIRFKVISMCAVEDSLIIMYSEK